MKGGEYTYILGMTKRILKSNDIHVLGTHLQVSVDYFIPVTVADTVKYLLHTFAAERE